MNQGGTADKCLYSSLTECISLSRTFLFYKTPLIEIKIKGIVQGVGFRYQAQRYASGLGLSGWVRNEYDGSVCMEVQGDLRTIDQLLRYLTSDRYIEIDWMDSKQVSLVEANGFHVRY